MEAELPEACVRFQINAAKLPSKAVEVFPFMRMALAIFAQHVHSRLAVAVNPVVERMPSHLRVDCVAPNQKPHSVEEGSTSFGRLPLKERSGGSAASVMHVRSVEEFALQV